MSAWIRSELRPGGFSDSPKRRKSNASTSRPRRPSCSSSARQSYEHDGKPWRNTIVGPSPRAADHEHAVVTERDDVLALRLPGLYAPRECHAARQPIRSACRTLSRQRETFRMLLRHRPPGIESAPPQPTKGFEHLDARWIAVLRWLQANRIEFVLVGPAARADPRRDAAPAARSRSSPLPTVATLIASPGRCTRRTRGFASTSAAVRTAPAPTPSR